MLTTFYNYYLNTYYNKPVTRYDTHKKSELRNVYNAIVKLNKESPLYMINMSDDLQTNAIDIKEHARSLKNVITALSENEDSTSQKMFNDKIVTSSSEDKVSVSYIGSGEDIDISPVLDIEVQSLASPQVNKGRFLYPDSKGMESKVYSFDVKLSNTGYEFQFTVKENETNDSVMKRLANMINRADIGLYAEIESDEANEKKRISLTSTTTGAPDFSDTIFQISDDNTTKASGAVKYLGLDQVAVFPEDSHFIINGTPRMSSSNTFTVNKTYELTLKDVTEENEPVNISFQNDKSSIFNKITTFVNSYNDMVRLANDTSSSVRKSSKLLADIGSISQCYKNELDSMGLIVQADSSIAVDEALLNQAIEDEEARDGTFAAFRSFRNPLSRKIDNVLLNPMDYIAKTIVTYPNIGHNFGSSYVTSMYSGLLFNGYC